MNGKKVRKKKEVAQHKKKMREQKRLLKRKLEKEARNLELIYQKNEKLLDNSRRPYMKPETRKAREAEFKERDEKIKVQLEHNMKILEAMEEEHIKYQLEKEELNKELEEKGLKTVKEKIEYLKEKAKKEAEEMPGLVLGKANEADK